MSETEKTPAKPKTKTATENLMSGWAIAWAAGAEVPVDVLDSPVAKANDWASKVK